MQLERDHTLDAIQEGSSSPDTWGQNVRRLDALMLDVCLYTNEKTSLQKTEVFFDSKNTINNILVYNIMIICIINVIIYNNWK